MIYPIYAIHDALVGYQSPTTMNNDAFALRAFSESFTGVKNAADYSLWKIGNFDTDTGIIESITPVVIARASDFEKGEEDA